MSRVLFLVNHEVVIYNFRLELVERLLKEGHQVIISSPYGEKINDLIQLGCQFEEAKISNRGTNPVEDIKLLLYYKSLLKRVRPDMVFTYTIKPNIYGGMACQSLKIPYVVNITGLGTAVENGGILQKITIPLYRLALNKVQRVFFQNTDNMRFFADRGLALGKHKLLPGSGVNLKRFSVLEYPDAETVEFAFISRVMKEKGIEQYLEAAERIREKHLNTRFHICGLCDEVYRKKLEALEEKGVVHYHGMLRNVQDMLSYTHCTVHPTYYPEGLSNTLLESCACGRPIITTDRSGCREVIDDGVNGFICKQRESADLILQIEKFLSLTNEQRKEMGLAGRKKVETEFDRQIVVDAYMKELEK